MRVVEEEVMILRKKLTLLFVVLFVFSVFIIVFTLSRLNNLSTQQSDTKEYVIVTTLTQINNVFIIDKLDDCIEIQRQYLHAYAGLIALKTYLRDNQLTSHHLTDIVAHFEEYFLHYNCPDSYNVDADTLTMMISKIITDVDNDLHYLKLEAYLKETIR